MKTPILLMSLFFIFALSAHSSPLLNCKKDIDTHCAAAFMGPKKILQCLRDHQKDLSLSCQRDIRSMKPQFVTGREDCESDINKYCAKTLPGNGRTYHCLRRKFKDLTPTCTKAIRRHIASQIK